MNRTVLLLGCVALVAGCGQGSFSQQGVVPKGNVLRYPIVTNPTTLDPGKVQDGDTIDMLSQVFEGLVGWDEQTKVVPKVAEKWEVQDDGKTYVFTLRKGVKFHNGREVTAEDFRWTFERNTDPKLGSGMTQYISDIVGVDEKVAGKAATISGVEVRDPYTLALRIKRPSQYFLGKLTYLVSAALAKESTPVGAEITDVKQMIGCGPFKVASYDREQRVVLDAFKEYHEGAPLIDKIERQVVKDAQTRLLKFKNGEFDYVPLERQDVPGIQRDPKLSSQLKFYDRAAIYYVGMNQLVYAPFKDVRVRRAFAMAIDKNQIVSQLLGGISPVANSIVPPGVLGFRQNANAIPFDPAQGKRLLEQAGFKDGSQMPPFEMNFRSDRPDVRIVAEAVASQLDRNLGVKVKLRSIEWASYLDKWNRRTEIGFFHMRWAADYNDPENFLSFMLASYGPENKIGYSNPTFDELCRQADSSMDTAKRLELYAKAEDLALQDAPWIPIYFQRDAELQSPRLKGIRDSLFGHLPHTKVTLGATP